MKFKGVPTFENYFEIRESQDITSNATQPGTFQSDPDKDDRSSDLLSALKEIVALAQKAIDIREKGLGDADANQNKGNEEPDGASLNNLTSKPKADGPEAMFGNEQN